VPAVIAWVSDRDPAMLRYLGDRGLMPDTEITVVAKEPFNGPITVQTGKASHVLGAELAHHIRVTTCTKGAA
jgi:DtxR family Mn-dependent transcriptional regulator